MFFYDTDKKMQSIHLFFENNIIIPLLNILISGYMMGLVGVFFY